MFALFIQKNASLYYFSFSIAFSLKKCTFMHITSKCRQVLFGLGLGLVAKLVLYDEMLTKLSHVSACNLAK